MVALLTTKSLSVWPQLSIDYLIDSIERCTTCVMKETEQHETVGTKSWNLVKPLGADYH